MRIAYSAVFAVVCCVACVADCVAREVVVAPGGVAAVLAGLPADVDELRLTGSADIRDFRALASADLAGVAVDLSSLTIAAYEFPPLSGGERGVYGAGELPPYALACARMAGVMLPAMPAVPEGLLAGSEVAAVRFHPSTVSVGDYALYGCRRLESLMLPAAVKSVGVGAFGACDRLAQADMGATGVQELPSRLFAGCGSLAEISLPPSLRSIGTEAFAGTALERVEAPQAVADAFAFAAMPRVRSITHGGIPSDAEGVFMACPVLADAGEVPADVPALYAAASPDVPAAGIMLAAETVKPYALYGNAAYEVSLGRQLHALEANALTGMRNLWRIDACDRDGDMPEADEAAFEGLECKAIQLRVRSDWYEVWKNSPVWSRFNIISVSSSVSEEDREDVFAVGPVAGGIRVSARGLCSVRVCDVSGMTLAEADCDSDSADIAVPAGAGVCVVTAVTAGGRMHSARVLM